MGKIYVDMEDLENLFAKYSIPYTNIFDELTQVSSEEVAEKMSVLELETALDKKEEVFATQIWQKSDVEAAINVIFGNAMDTEPDEGLVEKIISKAKPMIEDCSDNWDKLHAVVKKAVK